jgi:hypothetical protein
MSLESAIFFNKMAVWGGALKFEKKTVVFSWKLLTGPGPRLCIMCKANTGFCEKVQYHLGNVPD